MDHLLPTFIAARETPTKRMELQTAISSSKELAGGRWGGGGTLQGIINLFIHKFKKKKRKKKSIVTRNLSPLETASQ